jgi:hypothetical protein
MLKISKITEIESLKRKINYDMVYFPVQEKIAVQFHLNKSDTHWKY